MLHEPNAIPNIDAASNGRHIRKTPCPNDHGPKRASGFLDGSSIFASKAT
jgi:hypothetical protein